MNCLLPTDVAPTQIQTMMHRALYQAATIDLSGTIASTESPQTPAAVTCLAPGLRTTHYKHSQWNNLCSPALHHSLHDFADFTH